MSQFKLPLRFHMNIYDSVLCLLNLHNFNPLQNEYSCFGKYLYKITNISVS